MCPASARLLVLVLVAALAGGCGAFEAPPPPNTTPDVTAPAVTPVFPGAKRLLGDLPALVEDGIEQRAEEMTVRIRNTSCYEVGAYSLGSGFALTHHLIVTNRHVLDGTERLQVDTWDGHSYALGSPLVGRIGDIGFVTTGGSLGQVASFAPARSGERIMAVGYPEGGPLTVTYGRVLGFAPISRYGRYFPDGFHSYGEVLRITAHVEHGSSGGPVLDMHGKVIGVVYGFDPTTKGVALALPISTVAAIVRKGGLEAPPC
jgi:S1-C subfamily serine protease